jgi:hypothetical protein
VKFPENWLLDVIGKGHVILQTTQNEIEKTKLQTELSAGEAEK